MAVLGFTLQEPATNHIPALSLLIRTLAITCKRCLVMRLVAGSHGTQMFNTLHQGDDVPDGEVTSFPKAVQCKEDETVVFSWAVWPSKTVRDAGMQKMMADEAMQNMENSMPFDGKRLIYGGFQMVVDQ